MASITSSDRERLIEQGWLVVPDVVPKAWIDELSRLQEEETSRAASPESGYAVFVDAQYFSSKTHSLSPFQAILLARINSYWEHGELLKLHSGEFAVFKPKSPLEQGMPGPAPAQLGIPR